MVIVCACVGARRPRRRFANGLSRNFDARAHINVHIIVCAAQECALYIEYTTFLDDCGSHSLLRTHKWMCVVISKPSRWWCVYAPRFHCQCCAAVRRRRMGGGASLRVRNFPLTHKRTRRKHKRCARICQAHVRFQYAVAISDCFQDIHTHISTKAVRPFSCRRARRVRPISRRAWQLCVCVCGTFMCQTLSAFRVPVV